MTDLGTAVFFTVPDESDDSRLGRVKVVFGRLPSSTDNAAVTLHGPIDIVVPEAYAPQKQVWLPKPVYDEQKDRIVWAVPCKAWREDRRRDPDDREREARGETSLLSIGKYFTLQAADRPAYRGPDNGNNRMYELLTTSVIAEAETGLITVGNLFMSGDYPYYEINFGQKRDNSGVDSWFYTALDAPFENKRRPFSRDKSSVLFNHPSPNNKTVYNLSLPADYDYGNECFFLDAIPSVVFSNLYKDKTVLWRRYKLKTRGNVQGSKRVCPLLTQDSNSSKFYLWIFYIVGNQVLLSSVKLRKDGSVASYNNDITTADHYELNLPSDSCDNLCVLHYSDKVVISWVNNGKAEGRIGVKSADGRIQLPLTDWKEVKFNFDNEKGRISDCGLVVHNDFDGFDETDK